MPGAQTRIKPKTQNPGFGEIYMNFQYPSFENKHVFAIALSRNIYREIITNVAWQYKMQFQQYHNTISQEQLCPATLIPLHTTSLKLLWPIFRTKYRTDTD
jgi:hypothetical protein